MAAESPNPEYTADEALTRLEEGNARFLRGEARFPVLQTDILADLAKAQRPFATILGCSDSRVPPELLFDAGFGDLFIVRVAGNVVSPEVLGSLQYAGVHLRTPLFVVLGHSGCGAVKAALAERQHGPTERRGIAQLLSIIQPGLTGLSRTSIRRPSFDAAVEANVRWSMRQVLETPGSQGPVGGRRHEARGRRVRHPHRRREIPAVNPD